MSFTTLNFLFFFAIVFWGYYLIPKRWQWIWLLVASFVFYAFSAWWALFYLAGTIALTYGGARWIDALEGKRKEAIKNCPKEEKSAVKKKFERKKRGVLAGVLVLLVGLLAFVKYTNFFLDIGFKLMGGEGESPALSLLVPIGLSFYLFQNIGYLIDVYRGQYEAEKNPFRFALAISYFPHLLQGPLDDYKAVSTALYASREFDDSLAVSGAKRAAWGFFKKLVIANQAASICNPIISAGGGYDGLSVITCMVLYAIELYADFSGYMDIAIGCSRMLGVPIAENFRSPYFSGSIAEFWRRWHITLGTWFKNYLFYPILRSKWCSSIRKGLKKHKYLANTLPNVIALCIVWVLIGLWHGANISYVLYGIYHGGFIVLETVFAPLYDKFHKKFPKVQKNVFFRMFRVVRTFALVTVGYYLFAPAAISLTKSLILSTFEWEWSEFVSFGYYNFRELLVVLFSTAVLVFVDAYGCREDRLPLSAWVAKQKAPVRYLLYIALIFSILLLMVYGGEAMFAYFKF